MTDRCPTRLPTPLAAHRAPAAQRARPALDVLHAAGVPALVASGDHAVAIERICDALAMALQAERLTAPGAGHFVAAAPGFADRLEQFLVAVGQAHPRRRG
jgi:hypothetical protein